jgi:hypothetical protein
VGTEEASIEFLQHHLETSFAELNASHLILDIEWLEEYDRHDNEDSKYSIRAIARLGEDNKESNLLCLFPPFYPNK